MQTKEDRIRRHHKALKKAVYRNSDPVSYLWMTLARKWRMPIREIKQIVKQKEQS